LTQKKEKHKKRLTEQEEQKRELRKELLKN
jgi:hypothetical protein